MLIVCPSCTTAYRITLTKLGPEGRSVRCSRCKNVWQATAADAKPLPVEAFVPSSAPAAPRAEITEPPPASSEQTMDWSADALEAPSGSSSPEPRPIAVESPSLVPEMQQDPALPDAGHSVTQTVENIESVAARRDRPRPRPRPRRRAGLRRPSAATMIVVLAAVITALIAGRAAVVGAFPQTASLFAALHLPVNLRGLEFADVTSTASQEEGAQVLLVTGRIVNVTKSSVEVPRLRFALRNIAHQEVYAWTVLPDKSVLAAGEALPFQTRLASPPSEGIDVAVRFFNKHDIPSGFR
jgi:predicted Zn finger-like uncharacterized protein